MDRGTGEGSSGLDKGGRVVDGRMVSGEWGEWGEMGELGTSPPQSTRLRRTSAVKRASGSPRLRQDMFQDGLSSPERSPRPRPGMMPMLPEPGGSPSSLVSELRARFEGSISPTVQQASTSAAATAKPPVRPRRRTSSRRSAELVAASSSAAPSIPQRNSSTFVAGPDGLLLRLTPTRSRRSSLASLSTDATPTAETKPASPVLGRGSRPVSELIEQVEAVSVAPSPRCSPPTTLLPFSEFEKRRSSIVNAMSAALGVQSETEAVSPTSAPLRPIRAIKSDLAVQAGRTAPPPARPFRHPARPVHPPPQIPSLAEPSHAIGLSFKEPPLLALSDFSSPSSSLSRPSGDLNSSDTSSSPWASLEDTTLSAVVGERGGSVERGEGSKRDKIVNELLQTESSYVSDLKTIQEVYLSELQSRLSHQDIKTIFVNLAEVLSFSLALLADLEAAEGVPSRIAEGFLRHVVAMKSVYGTYCTNHHTAMARLAVMEKEVASFAHVLETCNRVAQTRTTAWDLGSLLVKPVQRVLKYPLLLQSLLGTYDGGGGGGGGKSAESEALANALQVMLGAADHINSVKAYKELVDSFIQPPSRPKRLGRLSNGSLGGRERSKSTTSVVQLAQQEAGPLDSLVAALDNKETMLLRFKDGLGQWSSLTCGTWTQWRQMIKATVDFWTELEARSSGEGLETSKAVARLEGLNAVLKSIIGGEWRELDTKIRTLLVPQLSILQGLFRTPRLLLQRHEEGRLELKGLVLGNNKSGARQSLKERQVSLYQLISTELPAFLKLVDKWFALVLNEFLTLQTDFYARVAAKLGPFLAAKYGRPPGGDTVLEWQGQVVEMEKIMADMDSLVRPSLHPQWSNLSMDLRSPSPSSTSLKHLDRLEFPFN